MNKKEFKKFLRECIEEVLVENISDNDEPLYVEYHSQRQGENPFMLGGTKYEYVNAKYPDGKIDVGVYSFAEDLVYSYNVFRSRHNIKEREETFYQDASDYEDMAAEVGRDIEAVEKSGLKAQYDSLMNGIFKLPIAEFDKRSEQLRLLVQKAYQIVGGEKVNEGKRICAWCKKELGQSSTELDSHGMCTDCKEKMLKDKNNKKVDEISTTGGVQGFLSKNWVDADPKRKRMKSIAAKSVGGKVT